MRALLLPLLSCLLAAAPATVLAQSRGGFGMRAMHGRGFWPAHGMVGGYFRRPPMDFARPRAWWGDQQYWARSGVRQGHFAPLGRVLDGIARRTPGRQLDTTLEYLGVRPVYRVRWMSDGGRRIDYVVDAASGALMSER